MKKQKNQQQQRANNRRTKRLEAKQRRQSAKRAGLVVGSFAVESDAAKLALFALLDAAGGSIDVTPAAIERATTVPLLLRSTPLDGGGYRLALVAEKKSERKTPSPMRRIDHIFENQAAEVAP